MITHWLPYFTPLCPTIQLAGLTTLWAQLPAPTRYPVPKRTLAGQGEKLFCSSQTCVAGKCRAPGSHPTPKLYIVWASPTRTCSGATCAQNSRAKTLWRSGERGRHGAVSCRDGNIRPWPPLAQWGSPLQPRMYDSVWHIVACQVLFSILCQVLL